MAATPATRVQRLRGRGSAYLGRAFGVEFFLPWLDWIVTFAVLFLFYQALIYFDRELRRQDLLTMIGYLGVAVMVQAVLYLLGSVLAALAVRLRIAALQLGPARRLGRFVTYADRGRSFTLFYALRQLPVLLGWWVCSAAFTAGASPLFAVIAQICAISLAFALLPIPGSDGHRFVQALIWWLTGSFVRAAWWGSLVCAVLAALGGLIVLDRAGGPTARGDGLIYLIVGAYLVMGLFSHLSALAAARKLRGLDAVTLGDVSRPVAVALPGNLRDQFPRDAIVVVSDSTQFLGVVDDSSVGGDPVEQHLLPCPAGPVVIDPYAGFAEAFLGVWDEGCDAVVLQSGSTYACLTVEDCALLLARHDVPYDNHLALP